MIAIIDYGLGNLRSISRKIERLGYESVITRRPDTLAQADKLILPGVGHFKTGISNLGKYNLIPILDDLVIKNKKPILGICLGMQLFCAFSQEGNAKGLGWIDAQVNYFGDNPKFPKFPIPHMGWNTVSTRQNDNCLLRGQGKGRRYYFVHSYYVDCHNRSNVIATAKYGIEFDATVQKDNVYGVQFHPEKSHYAGLEIINNFIKHA